MATARARLATYTTHSARIAGVAAGRVLRRTQRQRGGHAAAGSGRSGRYAPAGAAGCFSM